MDEQLNLALQEQAMNEGFAKLAINAKYQTLLLGRILLALTKEVTHMQYVEKIMKEYDEELKKI